MDTRRPPALSAGGMVSSSHPAASLAGARVLADGGNAVDATLAMAALTWLTLPGQCGIGGDAFAVVREPDGRVWTVNGSGYGPDGGTRDFYTDRGFSAIPLDGALAVAVPGAPAALARLHTEGATWSLEQLWEPAARIAESGLPCSARTAGDVTTALENFLPQDAARGAEAFVESLSNWYVRRSRRRFWKSGLVGQNGDGGDLDKLSAYATLYEVLETLSRLLAPIIPFLTESMYQNLVRGQGIGKESVHLADYPVADASLIDEQLSQVARLAMRFSSLGRAARSKAGIKVRQPIETALVKTRSADETRLLDLVAPQVMDELNVRHVEAIQNDSEIASVTLQPNMPILGPKYGRDLTRIRQGLTDANAAEVAALVESGQQAEIDGFTLEPEEVLVSRGDQDGYSTSTEAGYMVAITTAITYELKLEGQARELVHRIQGMRRDAGFDIADHIATYYEGGDELTAIVATHGDYIRQETLSAELIAAAPPADASREDHSFDGIDATIGLVRQ